MDEDWLMRLRGTGWVVLGRDLKIMERPRERAAYQAARVHMFVFPGQLTLAQLVQILNRNLVQICTIASSRTPGAYRVTTHGCHKLP